ncbi:MAG: hypothetical protein QOC59_1952 [Microbacteriaceae bacterium]|nr:hypothetical protein [Microbacteriaceae bacterium]
MAVEDAVAGFGDPGRRDVASERDAPTPFERARSDRSYLERLRDAYRGDDDLLDALWWLDHPAREGPSGATAPLTRLAAARAELYGSASPSGAVERVTEATRVADRSRAAALAAVEQVAFDTPRRRPVALRPAASRPLGIAPDGAAGPEHPQPVASAPVLQRGTALGVVAPLVAVAALVGIVAGFGISAPARPAATPRLAPPIVQHFEQTAARGDALEVFDVAQRPSDLPGGVAGSLDSSSFRRLVVLGDARIVAARTPGAAPGGICLLVVDTTSHVSGSCSSVAAFRRSGLTLERPEDRLPGDVRRIRWYPDGRVVWWSPLE